MQAERRRPRAVPFLSFQRFHTEQLIAKSLQDASCSHVQLRDNGCMQERTSKQLLFVESIIFLVPVSLLTGLYALFLIPMYASGGLLNEPLAAHAVPLFTIVGLILQLCGWRIIAAFLIDGRHGLRTVATIYVYASVLGAVIVAASGLVVLLMLTGFELADYFGFLTPNYLAVPALVPFIHLMIERWHSGTE